jgi:hypothetical protein
MLLTRTERDFLLGKREFSKGYSYTTKSRLLKKLELLVNEELPILIEKGYLTADCKVSNRDLTVGYKVRDSVVRISRRDSVKEEEIAVLFPAAPCCGSEDLAQGAGLGNR